MEKYEPKNIEKKWQKYWEENRIYKNYSRDKKFYVLDMFPYPSGVGLHVGHPKGYIATDIVSRYKMLQGFSVLHPMGWDAFGLPAENYAIKNKSNPNTFTAKSVANYKKQLEMFGFTYDWDREINTTDPAYYKWTQWIFLKLFEKGLAYESNAPINWCPSCKTGLSNEDLEDGKCERCGSEVEQKPMRQWVLKMTEYADRLLYDLDSKELDWEDMIVEQQKNWIGRSEGVEFSLKIFEGTEQIRVYTTRIDTAFGITYAVVAPEHEIIEKLKDTITNYQEVLLYVQAANKKTNLERTELQKEKTGVRLEGINVVNPFTGEQVPLFVADYVLGGYGTGAVMAVPAHDERDYAFAKKYNLPIIKSIESINSFVVTIKDSLKKNFYDEVRQFASISEKDGLIKIYTENIDKVFDVAKENFIGAPWYIHSDGLIKKILFHTDNKNEQFDWSELVGFNNAYAFGLHAGINKEQLDWNESIEAMTDDGILVNSSQYSQLDSAVARENMTQWLEKEGIGNRKVNYKMRDWVYSRQRYWGEPIPIIHCEKCGAVGVPESELPVVLPDVENYEPTGTGESPLAAITDWVNTTCPKCGGNGKRETNTMPQWGGSSWYYLRYIDTKNDHELVGKELEKEWMPVDLYVGGAEHATRHLLYARFWHKFLYDIGVVSTIEPFKKLVHVGLIMAEDGRKMSKRWNNVVNPDEVIAEFGADAMRMYEMFMGPFTQSVSWSTSGVSGVRRFLDKVWKLQYMVTDKAPENKKIKVLLTKTIKKVTEDIDNFRFNTAVSAMMILVNEMEKQKSISSKDYLDLIIILAPFAPHLSEELYAIAGKKESIFLTSWPQYDPAFLQDEEVEMVVQVNGKLREKLTVACDVTEDEIKETALESEKVRVFTDGKQIRKIIFVPGKLLNIVVE
jgi:leucyl-tRNA synthetase